MQTERTGLTAEQISLVLDTLQNQVEQADRSLDAAYECAKTIERAAEHGAAGSRWDYVAESAHRVAENVGGRGSAIDPELALHHIDALRDLVSLAANHNDPLD